MDKATFKEILKRAGYTIDTDVDIPTVLLVGATNDEIKKTFFEVKLFAQKKGYHHSISVKNLKEENANEHADN